MPFPTYFEAFDAQQMLRDYPIGGDFVARYRAMSRDELRALQNQRFLTLMKRGWQVPFYQRLWGGKGIEQGDIRSLDDIVKLPVYDKSDVMASVAEFPPFGDFAGREGADAGPIIFHSTSGTTGRPQPVMFGPKGREISNLLLGRQYRWQGLQSADVVQSVYGHGMVNGGHYIREAVTHFTNSIFLSAGTGLETRSVQQVALMRDFGTSVLVGFSDYLRKLADVAKAEGLLDQINIRMISGHLRSEDRAGLEQTWGGAKAFDWYGVADTGCIAGEGPERDGLYVWEDAQFLELLDVDSGQPVAAGDMGDMVVTCLYKDDVAPCIRFNTHDVTQQIIGSNQSGMVFQRIAGFKGRSDNMVKLRGMNIFPHAIGAILDQRSDLTGEYICHLRRDADGREDMRVTVESRTLEGAEGIAHLLRAALGVAVGVELVGVGETAALTQIEQRQKPIRLIDERG